MLSALIFPFILISGCLFPNQQTLHAHKAAIRIKSEKDLIALTQKTNSILIPIRFTKSISPAPDNEITKAEIVDNELRKLLDKHQLDPHISFKLEKTVLKASRSRSTFIYKFFLEDLPVLDSHIKAHFVQSSTLIINGAISIAQYDSSIFKGSWSEQFSAQNFQGQIFNKVYPYLENTIDDYQLKQSISDHEVSFSDSSGCVASDNKGYLRKSHCLVITINNYPFSIAVTQLSTTEIEVTKVTENFFIN